MATAQYKLPENLSIGMVSLNVKNIEKMIEYYTKGVGLEILERTSDTITLGTNKAEVLILQQKESLQSAKSNSAGLYHSAILFQDKAMLAQCVQSVIKQFPESFEGTGDHIVSQAFYFHDPEGNGLELYVDRPRTEWQWNDGQIVMGTYYIDPEEFIKESLQTEKLQLNYRIGHVHLKIGDIPKAKEFYVEALGFDITFEMPTALFISAGGYHHHLGLNTWESFAAPPRQESLGLDFFTIYLHNEKELEKFREHLTKKNIKFKDREKEILLLDPWNNKITITL
jgi:catechol 2,3-dioxygenase